MADFLEEAEEASNLMLEEALRKRAKVPEKTGFCLACDEPTEGAFCSADCREDYERLARLKAISGKKQLTGAWGLCYTNTKPEAIDAKGD